MTDKIDRDRLFHHHFYRRGSKAHVFQAWDVALARCYSPSRLRINYFKRSVDRQKTVQLPSDDPVEAQLVKLGVDLNSTICKLLADAPFELLQSALSTLSEAVKENRVGNPSGFFYHAVMFSWKPNEFPEKTNAIDIFNQWWTLAYAQGLVKAATVTEGIQQVLNTENRWVPFDEVLSVHPLAQLAQNKKGIT